MRLLTVCIAVAALVGCAQPQSVSAEPEPKPTPRAKNVILFVGDGMGISTVTGARILEGQQRGESGEENLLSFERFPHTAFSKTYTVDMQVPDSAGTMTAMMSGIKTLSGVIGVAPSVGRSNCEGLADASVPTLLEQAEEAGRATGVISTARITHATPAATYAHSPDRNWEADSALPQFAAELGCRDIARQLVEFEHGDGIEVVLGGGRAAFIPADMADPEDEGGTGFRADGRNLIAQWRARFEAGKFVWNDEQFKSLDPQKVDRVLGLFEASHMEYEADRPADSGGEPSLAEMTGFAIKALQKNRKGFFLMVEAGRIDHGHHASNAYRALGDTIALSDAVAVAAELTSVADTLIIVTADHSHTLTIAGYPARGNPILGKVTLPGGNLLKDATGLPYTTLQYANGPGALMASADQAAGPKHFPHRGSGFASEPFVRADLTEVDTTAQNFLQEALVPMASETHAGEDVPVYARGPGAQEVHGVIEQHKIYHIMRGATGW